MASIFSKIYNAEIPGYFVAKNEEFFAILDISPLTIGHVLVIPIKETDYLFDLDPLILARYMQFTQKVAKAIESVIECKRVGVAVIGLEVPHAHIHLVPINGVGDINFEKPKLSPSSEVMQETCKAISEAFISLDQDSEI
jgi:histidine triad (HIT) family protein